MGKFIIILAITGFLFACSENTSGSHGVHKHDSSTATTSRDTSKKSIPTETKKWIGNTEVKINYHAPAVRGRVIWGGLVPYNEVWVTGAHSATSFEVGKDFLIGNKRIPAGKYALFTIPGKEEWTIILNKNWNQHLADDYKESEDVWRTKVKPKALNENVERLQYEIDQTGERRADIIISWEKISVAFGIEII